MVRRGWLLVELLVLAILTLAGYAALQAAQRALWTNGLTPGATSSYPRSGADVSAGGVQSLQVVLLGLAVTALFAWLVIRAPQFARARLSWVAVGIPLLVCVGLYLSTPALSIDAYSYLSHGYLAATPGFNPYWDASASVAGTPYGEQLLNAGWQAVHPQTPYGPVWTAIERLAYVASGGTVYTGILLIKLPVLLAVLGTAALIWRFLARIRPDRAARGALLYLANPLILVELVGEGHNDAVMAFFLVLAIVAAARRWAFVAIIALAFAVLVKLNAAPFAVPLAVALIALRRSARRLILEIALGVAVSAGVAVTLIAPYWAGLVTFMGLQTSGTPSPGWSVSGWLSRLVGIGQQEYIADASPMITVQLVLLVLLVLATTAASLLARTVTGLVRACGIVSLVVLLLLPLEWPWYATLPAAVLPLEAGIVDIATVIVLTAGSRVVAPIGDAASLGVIGTDVFTGAQALIGQTVPAVVGLVLTVPRAIRERMRRDALQRPGIHEMPPRT